MLRKVLSLSAALSAAGLGVAAEGEGRKQRHAEAVPLSAQHALQHSGGPGQCEMEGAPRRVAREHEAHLPPRILLLRLHLLSAPDCRQRRSRPALLQGARRRRGVHRPRREVRRGRQQLHLRPEPPVQGVLRHGRPGGLDDWQTPKIAASTEARTRFRRVDAGGVLGAGATSRRCTSSERSVGRFAGSARSIAGRTSFHGRSKSASRRTASTGQEEVPGQQSALCGESLSEQFSAVVF